MSNIQNNQSKMCHCRSLAIREKKPHPISFLVETMKGTHFADETAMLSSIHEFYVGNWCTVAVLIYRALIFNTNTELTVVKR